MSTRIELRIAAATSEPLITIKEDGVVLVNDNGVSRDTGVRLRPSMGVPRNIDVAHIAYLLALHCARKHQ